MAETFQKQVNVREADAKMKGNEQVGPAEKPSKAAVEKELKVEAKAEEKAKVAEALKKSEKMAEKPAAKPETPKPAEAKKAEKKEEPADKREIVLERVYTVPLADAYAKPAKKRAGRAVKLLREFLSRHMKSQNVKIDPGVNEFIEERGAASPSKAVRVNASKDKAGMVWAKLAGME